MKYDPMTGEPIEEVDQETTYAQAAQPTQSAQNFLQKILSKPVLLAVVGVVAVVAIVIIAAVSGVFMSDRDRVANAVVNTFEDQGALSEAFTSLGEVYANKENTTSVMVEYKGVEVRGEYRHTSGDKQLWAALDGAGFLDLEGTVTLTSSQVLANTPLLEDVLFVYNYTKDCDGYITKQLSDDELEVINQCLEMVYGLGSDSEELEIDEEQIKALKDWYKKIEVEKLDEKEEFEIDEKDKECTGYQVEITEDMLSDLFEIMGDIMDGTGALDGTGVSVDDYVDEMKDSIDGMPDIELTFYLDSNKLAAVIAEIDGSELEVLFKGGEYRIQNMEIKAEGETVIKIEGETEGKVETVKLEIMGQKFFQYEYDTKSGELEATIYDYYGDKVATVEATITVKGGEVTFADGNVEVEDESVDFEFSVKKGATIERLSGDEFDVGEASYSDFEDIAEELYDELY